MLVKPGKTNFVKGNLPYEVRAPKHWSEFLEFETANPDFDVIDKDEVIELHQALKEIKDFKFLEKAN